MPAVHRESHRGLLREFRAGPPRPVDAVIVPAGRSAKHLEPAAQLATELGCVLLAMCSPDGADPREFAHRARAWPGLEWHYLDIPADLHHPLLPATASPRPGSHDWRHGALSTKRNLALLTARMLDWRTVFLVDDDIVDLDPTVVRAAASRLGGASAVGLTVGQFPDNSVVCHANRLSGGRQDVFVGACALVLDTTVPFGFFPNVYNEDWLFLYDLVARHRVGRIDRARQLEYRPFADEARARAEEFGEVLAEGLMAGLEDLDGARPPMDAAYWSDFLRARRQFIGDTVDRLGPRYVVGRHSALRSLAAAKRRLGTISAPECASYVRRWRADLLLWDERVAALPSLPDFDAAAEHLGLTGSLAGLIA